MRKRSTSKSVDDHSNYSTTQRALSQADSKIFQGQLSPVGNDNTTHFEIKRFHYIHIPKTAGESFMLDSPQHIGIGSTLQGNREKTYYETPELFLDDDDSNTTHYSVVFLRNPTSHVLSQFLECKYDPYFRKIVNDLPGYSSLDNATDGFDEWILRFIELGLNSTYGKSLCYGCYEPWNMQARYLTASGKNDAHIARNYDGRFPSLEEAENNLRKMDVVGITEYYSASLCLLEFVALDGALSPLCRQCDPMTGKVIAQQSQHRESHGVPHHSVDMISDHTLKFIEENLTVIDKQLYERGFQFFMDEVDKVWSATGVDLLCRDNYYQQKKVADLMDHSERRRTTDPSNIPYLISFFILLSLLFAYFKGRNLR